MGKTGYHGEKRVVMVQDWRVGLRKRKYGAFLVGCCLLALLGWSLFPFIVLPAAADGKCGLSRRRR